MSEKFYKLPRAVCRLCGKEWAARNAEPRHHRCTHLTKSPPTPTNVSVLAMGLSVRVDLDEVSRLMNQPQIQALMAGIAQVVAVSNSRQVE